NEEATVCRLTQGDAARWDAFVQDCPNATFFHLSTWQGVIEDVLGHRTWYLFAERRGRIVGVLPLALVDSRLFGRSLASLPFCAYGGAVGEEAAVSQLEAAADRLARESGVEYLEYRNIEPRHAAWPRQDLYVTFRKPLLETADAN